MLTGKKLDTEHSTPEEAEEDKIALTRLEESLSKVLITKNLSLLGYYKQNSENLYGVFTQHLSDIKADVAKSSPDKPYLIVSLGCGFAEEPYILSQFLGKDFNKVKFVGIDIAHYMQSVNAAYQKAGFKNICICKENANDVKKVVNLLNGQTADLVIFRHPLFFEDKTHCAFTSIIKKVLPAITQRQGSRILATTYFIDEKKSFLEALHAGGNVENISLQEVPEEKSIGRKLKNVAEDLCQADKYILSIKGYKPKLSLTETLSNFWQSFTGPTTTKHSSVKPQRSK